MNIIPEHLLAKVQADFQRLNKDGDNFLNTQKDGISRTDGMNFFIAINQDVDIETFYQYNADKYGEDITDAFMQKREEVAKAYEEIKDKERASLELHNNAETRIDPQNKEMVEKFYSHPEEGMVYNFKGIDIKYQNGKYYCPSKDYIEPAKFIQGVTFFIKREITEDFYSNINNEFNSASSQEEKDSVVEKFVKGLLNIDGNFDYDLLAANYNTGTKLSRKVKIGSDNNRHTVLINYTLGENEVIVNDYKYYPS